MQPVGQRTVQRIVRPGQRVDTQLEEGLEIGVAERRSPPFRRNGSGRGAFPAVVVHDYLDRCHPYHDASVVGLSYVDDALSVGIRYHYLPPVTGNRVLGLCRFDIHDRGYQYGE